MLPDQFLSGRFELENAGDCCGPVPSGGNLSGGCFEYKAADVGAFVATKNVPLITIVAAEATRFYQHQSHGAVADGAFAMVKIRNHGPTNS